MDNLANAFAVSVGVLFVSLTWPASQYSALLAPSFLISGIVLIWSTIRVMMEGSYRRGYRDGTDDMLNELSDR